MTAQDRALEGGDALVETLARLGVKSLFSISGGPINSAYFATTRNDVRIVHVRHEAAATFMAESVYRSTGVPGAVLATLGPGVANTASAAACAMLAGVPLIIVGGQAATTVLNRGAGMEMDTMAIMRPVTKWTAQVLHADRIPEVIDEAYRRMMSGTPGPVYVEIPTNVMASPVSSVETRSAFTPPSSASPSSSAMEQAKEMLSQARQPLVIAGDGVFHDQAESLLQEFVASSKLPVGTVRLARGAIDETTCPQWYGPAYIPCNPVFAQALSEADLVLLLGHHWEFDLEFGDALGPNTKVIQVHRDEAYLGRNGRADLQIHADVGPFLEQLAGINLPNLDSVWIKDLPQKWAADKARLTSLSNEVNSEDPRPHPLQAIDAVTAAAPPEARFITSHGNVDFWADPRIEVRDRSKYLRSGQSGALGAELPFAVGSALEQPDAPSILIVGDGAIGYHLAELETAARFNAPVIAVVLDDNSWGAIAMPQRMGYDVEVALELPPRDWVSLAQGLGANGYSVELEGVGQALEDAIAQGGPAIIHVPVRSELSPYMAHIS